MRTRLWICVSLAAALAGCGKGSRQPFEAHVHNARVANTRIAWYERGQGPPLVMLIGHRLDDGRMGSGAAAPAGRDHRLILFDYPGLGLSGPWHGRSFDSLAETHRRPDEGNRRARGRCPGLVDGRLRRPAPGRRPSGSGLPSDLGRDQPRRQPRRCSARRRLRPSTASPTRQTGTSCASFTRPTARQRAVDFLRRIERASQTGEIPDDFDVPAATTVPRSLPRTPGFAATATTASWPASARRPWPRQAVAIRWCRR